MFNNNSNSFKRAGKLSFQNVIKKCIDISYYLQFQNYQSRSSYIAKTIFFSNFR